MQPDTHNLITVKETAKYLNIPLPTVYYLVQRGQLPAVQIGGRWRVKKDLLDIEVLGKKDPATPPAVLVVDDDEGIQSMFRLFLKKQRFASVIAASGQSAISAIQKQKFEFCFLDLQLPDITGDEIYRQAKEIQPDLPVVIITGYPDSQMMENILKLGPVAMLRKPLRIEDLQHSLKLLGRKNAEQAA